MQVSDFLDITVFTTLGGCISIVFLTASTLRSVLGWSPKYVGLLLSLFAAVIAAKVRTQGSWADWIMTIPNTFVIFAGATGISSITAGGTARRAAQPPDAGLEEIIPSPRFWRRWF